MNTASSNYHEIHIIFVFYAVNVFLRITNHQNTFLSSVHVPVVFKKKTYQQWNGAGNLDSFLFLKQTISYC